MKSLTVLTIASLALAQSDSIVGTWSTKSNSTFTGPGFYDVAKDAMIEPAHPGISYSFTDDGFFEEAYFRAIANPVDPACPKGIMQWQHGKYQKLDNGSLVLTPIAEDGRQLSSDPCNYDSSIYSKYKHPEVFKRYEQLLDPYHNIPRLNLYRFDGSPIPAMYLAYRPPQMVPTTALHPAATASTKSGAKERLKRALEQHIEGPEAVGTWIDTQRLWCFGLGVGTMGMGGVLMYLS
ncbi:hypothetical protein Vi05172_g12767 [Venturia inaequalis]|nr:hypothetical protein Vi05172_g12767 [Venturia inaequalis]